MRILSCNLKIHHFFLAVTAVFSAAVCCLPLSSSLADDMRTGHTDKNAQSKIHITSDRMITDNDIKYAEFIGNVKANQGANIIVAERLKIYFKNTSNHAGAPVADQESIEKIVAIGNVTINFDDKVAVAQKAVYITSTRILVLTGSDSKITSGTDSISGEKITLFRDDGRINVESGSEKRVEAVFFSGKKGLN